VGRVADEDDSRMPPVDVRYLFGHAREDVVVGPDRIERPRHRPG
jgi:hypothetical protein